MKFKLKYALLAIAIIGLTFYIALTKTRLLGALLFQCTNCKIVNESGTKINAKIYRNFYAHDGTKVEEIIIFFPDIPTGKFVTIAVPADLIGLNDYGYGYYKIANHMFLDYRSLMFSPINENWDPLIEHYTIESNKTEFETFEYLRHYGEKIIVRY